MQQFAQRTSFFRTLRRQLKRPFREAGCSPRNKPDAGMSGRIHQSDYGPTCPLGSFTLPREKQKLGFVSGGIGITPLRSMLRYIADTKQAWDIVLLCGNARAEDIVFREELDDISQTTTGLRIVHVLENPPNGWEGYRGFINQDIVVENIPDYAERLFFISGPPRMVTQLEDQLLRLNIPPSQLRRDSFTGYD